MEKRGQFFIIFSLFAVIVIFSFISIVTYKKSEEPEIFIDLGKNFKFEVIDVLAKGKKNNANQNLLELLDNITYNYLKYAINEDPNIEIIYLYGNLTNIFVYNFGNFDACVYLGNNNCNVVYGGRRNISSTLSLGEIKETIVNHYSTYKGALNFIRKIFQPEGNEVIIQVEGVNYTFYLKDYEQFYLILKTRRKILKTRRKNETIVSIQ